MKRLSDERLREIVRLHEVGDWSGHAETVLLAYEALELRAAPGTRPPDRAEIEGLVDGLVGAALAAGSAGYAIHVHSLDEIRSALLAAVARLSPGDRYEEGRCPHPGNLGSHSFPLGSESVCACGYRRAGAETGTPGAGGAGTGGERP